MSVGGGSPRPEDDARARALGRTSPETKRGGKAKTNSSRRPEGTAEKQTFGNRRRRARIRRAWIDRGGGGVGRGTYRRRAFSRRLRAPRSLPPSTPRTPCAGWAWPWSAASWPAVAEARGMWEGCEPKQIKFQPRAVAARTCARGAFASRRPRRTSSSEYRARLSARARSGASVRGARRGDAVRENRAIFFKN